jgi:hypothetical protein
MNRFKGNTLRTYSVPTDPDGDGTFNPLDIISGVETIDYASLEQQILRKYLPLSGGTVSSLAVDNGFYIGNQQQQNFSSTEKNLLTNLDTKTSRMVFNGSKTTLLGQVDIETLTLTNSLPVSSVGNGTTTNTELGYLNGVTQPLQSSLNSLQTANTTTHTLATTTAATVATQGNTLTTHTNTLNTHTNTLDTHTQQLQSVETKTNGIDRTNGVTTITNLQSTNVDMTLLQNVTEDVQAALNNLSTGLQVVESDVATHTTELLNLQASIDTHTDKLQTVSYNGELHVSGTTNLDSVVVDSSLAVDGAFSIQNGTYSILDNQFHFLSSIDGDLKTSQNVVATRLDGHDNDVITLHTAVAAHSASITSHTDVLYMHDLTLESSCYSTSGANHIDGSTHNRSCGTHGFTGDSSGCDSNGSKWR